MQLDKEKYADLGFAKLDVSRENRTGTAEAVFCPGKMPEQLLKILQKFRDNGCRVIGTKCSKEQAEYLIAAGENVCYDETSRIVSLADSLQMAKGSARRTSKLDAAKSQKMKTTKFSGSIAVCCAGTADLPIAEEAAQTAEFYGAKVERFYDVGIAGLHRLLSKMENIRKASVVIAVAGMEGALAGVVAGLTKAPVIAVPTSVGYGASFGGISALLTMLNTCAEGVSVVNIDNGFGAAVTACRILGIRKK